MLMKLIKRIGRIRTYASTNEKIEANKQKYCKKKREITRFNHEFRDEGYFAQLTLMKLSCTCFGSFSRKPSITKNP